MKISPHQTLVVVTGPDGSGKSTACAKASESIRVAGLSISVCSIWDALAKQTVFSSKTAVGEYLSSLTGEARTLFLCHAMLQSLTIAVEKKTDLVLVDGYFYKYVASELAYGVSWDVVRGAAQAFPAPASTLFLHVATDEAWRRKEKTSSYERGEGGESKEAFLAFQNRMSEKWKQVRELWGPWKNVPPGDLESTAAAIVRECLCLKGRKG